MTAAEIRRNFDGEKAVAMAKAAPEYDVDDIPEMKGFKPGKPIRGFAAFKEYINRKGRPKSDDPRQVVSIRIPASALALLRATGRGWQTRAGDYLTRGVKKGAFGESAA
jgi:uncharacterized protein (DUF4415 family)